MHFHLLGLFATVLAAQEAPSPKVQPVVDLGPLAVGAIVEGSFGVYWDDAALAKATAVATPPKGVRVLRLTTQTYVERAMTTVEFAVDTADPGVLDGVFDLRCGTEAASVPMRAEVRAATPGGSRVLVAQTPFETFSSDDPKTFDAWRQLVGSAHLDVDYRLVQRGRPTFDIGALARVDVVLAGEDALLALDDQQVAKLQGFVCGGGRLIVCADAFFMGTVHGANRIAEAFDLAIVDRESGDGGWRVDAAGLRKHALTVGVDGIEVLRPSPVTIGEGSSGVALATFTTPREQPFVAMATTVGGGEMVVVGNSLWWNAAHKSPGFARLLRNLLQRAPRQR